LDHLQKQPSWHPTRVLPKPFWIDMGFQQQDGKPSPILRKLVGLLSGKYFDTENSSVKLSVHLAFTHDS